MSVCDAGILLSDRGAETRAGVHWNCYDYAQTHKLISYQFRRHPKNVFTIPLVFQPSAKFLPHQTRVRMHLTTNCETRRGYLCSQVQILSRETNEPVRALTRFRDAARCGSFRRDGLLLVAGCDDHQVRLFDVNNKALLRVFKAHQRYTTLNRDTTPRKMCRPDAVMGFVPLQTSHQFLILCIGECIFFRRPVTVTRFLNDNVRVMSGSDDRSLRLWDIASETETAKYVEHEVRRLTRSAPIGRHCF